jgi:hypothetical protein
MRKLTVDSSLTGLRELVDYTIWRVAMLVALLMLFAAVLGVLAVRLTSGHGKYRPMRSVRLDATGDITPPDISLTNEVQRLQEMILYAPALLMVQRV